MIIMDFDDIYDNINDSIINLTILFNIILIRLFIINHSENFILSEKNIIIFFILFIYLYLNLHFIMIDNIKSKYINHLIDENNILLNKLNTQSIDIPSHIKSFYIKYLINSKHNCSICLDIIFNNQNVFLTSCGHLFHFKCLNESFKINNKCPNCRKIYIDDYHYNQSNDLESYITDII